MITSSLSFRNRRGQDATHHAITEAAVEGSIILVGIIVSGMVRAIEGTIDVLGSAG